MRYENSEIRTDFAGELVSALQPARFYFLAQTIQFLFTSGLYDDLEKGCRLSSEELERFDSIRIHGLFDYLSNEQLVTVDASGRYRLTSVGRGFRHFRAWYELLLGGYSRTLDELPETMRSADAYAHRNDAAVGRGSCGISKYDALPMIEALLSEPSAPPATTIADLGCGDGEIVLQLGGGRTRILGVDPSPASIEAARKHATDLDLGLQSEFIAATAEDFLADEERRATPNVCYLAAFALQEVLEQAGRLAVVQSVARCLEAPGNSLIVVEVTPFDEDEGPMMHALEVAYYNPYFLMHTVTRQRLESEVFWRELFAEAGAEVLAWRTTDPLVDSTGHEFGVLLTKVGRL